MKTRTSADLLEAMKAREHVLHADDENGQATITKLAGAALPELEDVMVALGWPLQMFQSFMTAGHDVDAVLIRIWLAGVEVGREMERWAR